MGDTGNSAEKTKTSFFTGVKAEFNKIIWPAKKALGKQTVAVVVISVVLGVVITIIDVILKYGINFLVK